MNVHYKGPVLGGRLDSNAKFADIWKMIPPDEYATFDHSSSQQARPRGRLGAPPSGIIRRAVGRTSASLLAT